MKFPPRPGPHRLPVLVRFPLRLSLPLAFFATVLLITRSPHSVPLCDIFSAGQQQYPSNVINSHMYTDPTPSTVGDAWHNTHISAASQGKLWTPRRVRTYSPTSKNTAFEFRDATQSKQAVPTPPQGACHLWAVVTTIFPPSRTMFQLRALPREERWCVAVVGDRKTDDEQWVSFARGHSYMFYLSAAVQRELGYNLVRHTPWDHFGRKNVGYLFAVQNGATLIWDTDDDNELKLDGGPLRALAALYDYNTSSTTTREETSIIALKSPIPVAKALHPLCNPYPYFRPADAVTAETLPVIWPRGLPLQFVKDVTPSDMTLQNEKTVRVGVFQSLADNDPDIDAIYRLTRSLPIHFTSSSSSSAVSDNETPEPRAVALPNSRFAPLNAQATIWTREAFCALLLPISVHGRVSDIWRSYIAQVVLRYMGLQVAFHTPVVTQYRNAHAYLADLQAEIPLYTQAGALVAYLHDWKKPSGLGSVDGVMEKLMIDLYEIGLVELSDMVATQAWLNDLRSFGYQFPNVIAGDRDEGQEDKDEGKEEEKNERASRKHVSTETARASRVALCVGHQTNATVVDVAGLTRDVHRLFANAEVTTFVTGNKLQVESGCAGINKLLSKSKHNANAACVPSPYRNSVTAKANEHSLRSSCARAVDGHEMRVDEAFHWVLAVSAAGSEGITVEKLPTLEVAMMQRKTVFKGDVRCGKGTVDQKSEVMFGKGRVMRLALHHSVEENMEKDVGMKVATDEDVVVSCRRRGEKKKDGRI